MIPAPAMTRFHRCALFLVVALLAASVPLGAQGAASRPASRPALPGTAEGGWREWRADPLNSARSHGKVPSFKGLRWKYVAESGMQASPVVADGVVYIATKEGSIHALDFATGRRLFEKRITPATLPKEMPKGFGWSTPLVLDDVLVVGSDEARIYGISRRDGAVLWQVTTGEKVWASPKFDGRLVHVGCLDGKWYAINPKSGAVEWTLRLGGEIGGSACIVGDEAAVTSRDKKLHLIDLRRGKLITSVDTGGHSTSTPTLAAGVYCFWPSGGKFTGVDALSRTTLWKTESLGQYRTSSATDGERVYTTGGPFVIAFNPVDGAQLWYSRSGRSFDSSPVSVGDKVVAAGADSKLWVFDAATGAGGEVVDLGEPFAASPAVVDGLCIVSGTSGTVFAIE